MVQPPVPGHGAGEQPGRGARPPGGGPGGRDPRLGAFAHGEAADRCPPGPWMGMVLDELSGPGRLCPGATDDELAGLLGRWNAHESWAAAAKLGVIRELIRRRALSGAQVRRLPCGLPDAWDETVDHEVSAGLGLSPQAADRLIWLAWALEARIPRIGAALEAGIIDYVKARAIAEETSVLDDADLAAAEELILAAGLDGKTPGQIGKIAASAVVTVDPDGARRRREQAEKDDARVRFWRERAGTSALAGYGLPTDAALQANANVGQRADEYKKAGLDATMDQLRVLAYLDILNGISAPDRITQAQAEAAQAEAGTGTGTGAPDAGSAADASGDTGDHDPGDEPDDGGPSNEDEPDDGVDNDGSDDDGSDDDGPGGGPDKPAPRPGPAPSPAPSPSSGLAARANLTFPLATLLGLADRPGYAIGHGCAKPARNTRNTRQEQTPPHGNRDGPWAFTRHDDPGPPDGYGTWTLTMPCGQQYTVKLGPVSVTDCDHRHESHAYQPSGTLRHLVQIRDGECTFPTCTRHARESDFEHAIPYDKGGRTCGCNAGARSRRCHKVKQSKGWIVTQPLPGWHQWRTPSGRTYTQGPMQYPT